MTGTVSFPWIDNGEPLEVARIPINGERELKKILLRHSKFVTMQRNSFAHAFHGIVLAAYIVLEKKGVNDAKDSWDATLKQNGIWRKEFDWNHEEWKDRFMAYYEDHTLRQLGAKDFDSAKEELEKRMVALAEELQEMGDEPGDFDATYALTELYWRLRAAGARAVTPEGGDKIPLKWGRDSKSDVMDALGDYASAETLAEFRKGSKKDTGRFDIEDYVETDEETMRGKSEGGSKPSTKSSGDSQPSSGHTTDLNPL